MSVFSRTTPSGQTLKLKNVKKSPAEVTLHQKYLETLKKKEAMGDSNEKEKKSKSRKRKMQHAETMVTDESGT